MGFLDKVMFWKKKDEFADIGLGGEKDNLAFGNDLGAGQQVPGANPPGLGPTPGLGPDPGMQGNIGQQPNQGMQPPGPTMPSFAQQPPQPTYEPIQEMNSKNLEVISSKLDALRASIESLNQRLANLETIARGDEEQSRRKRYY